LRDRCGQLGLKLDVKNEARVHLLVRGKVWLRIPGEVARESAMMSPSIPI